jgi:hypothetical protein
MNSTGTYFDRKFKSSGAPVFTKQNRKIELDFSETRKITPGPGSYKKGSEFGYIANDSTYVSPKKGPQSRLNQTLN